MLHNSNMLTSVKEAEKTTQLVAGHLITLTADLPAVALEKQLRFRDSR